MSTEITKAFVEQYSSNIQMLSQQKGSLLRDKVRLESVTGKNAFFDHAETGGYNSFEAVHVPDLLSRRQTGC